MQVTWLHILPFLIHFSSFIEEFLLVARGTQTSVGRRTEELSAKSTHKGGLLGAEVLLNVH